jgi:hypothetical protein
MDKVCCEVAASLCVDGKLSNAYKDGALDALAAIRDGIRGGKYDLPGRFTGPSPRIVLAK